VSIKILLFASLCSGRILVDFSLCQFLLSFVSLSPRTEKRGREEERKKRKRGREEERKRLTLVDGVKHVADVSVAADLGLLWGCSLLWHRV